MPRRGPFVLAGEALVDVVVPIDGAEVDAPGGSPLNVAVGLSRLGLDTLLVTELGDDSYGELIRAHVESSGVRLDDGSVVPGHRTSSATAHLDADHAATYDFDLTWTLGPRTLPSDAVGLHVGSIGAALRPGRDSVVDLLDQAVTAGVFVSFDPNARPAFLPPAPQAWADMTEVAGHADLVKMSDEDVHVLAPDRTPAEVAAQLLGQGRTRIVVITEGGGGALGFTRRHRCAGGPRHGHGEGHGRRRGLVHERPDRGHPGLGTRSRRGRARCPAPGCAHRGRDHVLATRGRPADAARAPTRLAGRRVSERTVSL